MQQLLTRNQFREKVFARDNNLCVICKQPAKDAHHIIERRLFSDGGYYISNGASLCEEHHLKAESTELTCNEIRNATKINSVVIPDHFYDDLEYDKWGNIIMPTGVKLKGELYYDESVQKILANKNEFQKYVKYPRTHHLPWSHLLKDDRMLESDECFHGKHVVMTLKMDGENTTFYNDFVHARSINSGSHPTRNKVMGIWGPISYLIDDNMRICGENMYAKHSIHYSDLESYFLAFSMWIDNTCIAWKDTVEYFGVLGLKHVPVIYEGVYNKEAIMAAYEPYKKEHEGYVIRIADSFEYGAFRKSIAKYVNPEFRQALNNSHGHWISKKIEQNNLKWK